MVYKINLMLNHESGPGCLGLSISAMQLIMFISGWMVANVLILMMSDFFSFNLFSTFILIKMLL